VHSIFAEFPDLETPRLTLRRLRPQDAADLLEYASDPRVTRYTSWDRYESLADAQRFIHWAMDRYQRKSEAPWGIELKAEGKLIGSIGFTDYVALHRRAEINYALSAKYWGQGLTPEALERAIAHGFGPLRLHRIEARCIPENVASARVMEKVGMKYEGLLRQALCAKGKFHDMQVYAIVRDDQQPAA
jgi:[ribosomal protein S5]-alanine N-acetyltransferase